MASCFKNVPPLKLNSELIAHMKVEYISHACMLIDTGDLKIATDPWWVGPAYCGKWHVFPKPVRTDFVNDVDIVLISHGHEDHLNEPTLKLFPSSTKIFYPYSFFGGAKEYLESMGFEDVKEAITFRKYKLSENTFVTFIINSHDSIMVIESGGKVLVNVNDALHSYPEKVIDYYLQLIKEKWPVIDIIFCGFGGASYFPNTMHLKGKNDFEIGLVREQLFAHNFCRVVKGLKPKVAVPFAADFCLLDEDQLWINEARFPRRKMAEYYEQYFAEDGYKPQIIDMYSGDILENLNLIPSSPYRKQMKDGGLDHLIDEQYHAEIKDKQNLIMVEEAEAAALADEIKTNVEKRSKLFSREKLNNLCFSLKLTDVQANNFYNILVKNSIVKVNRGDNPEENSLLTMETSSEIVRYSIGSDWGADVVSIGYGAEIYISDNKRADVDLESICMNLLACYPTISDLKKTPLRTMKFLLLNPPKYTRYIRKLRKFSHESDVYDRKTWLLESPDKIRKKYSLPKLDRSFFK